MQIVNTDQSSGGYRAQVGSGVTLTNPAGTLVTDGSKYTDFLPSLNLNGELGGGNVVRFGVAQQIARPTLTDMRNSFAASRFLTGDKTSPVYDLLVGSGGNPHLKPFKAWAFDLSYEKYFGKKAYVSGALFYKKIETYIAPQTNLSYDFTPYVQSLGLAPSTTGKGNVGIFTTSVNGTGGNVHGFEWAVSAPFNMISSWLDGFGAYASYSNTGSTIKFPDVLGQIPNVQVPQVGNIAIPGLSKENAKLTLYFEKWGFSAFVADNYRSTYVGFVANDQTGGYPVLKRIQGSSWVSAQVGYEFQEGQMKGLSFRVEGNNLNNPVYRQLNRDNSIDTENKTGHTIIVKVSYKLQ